MDNAQLQIGDGDEQIIEQDDFAPLVRALQRARGFALYFVECNVPVYRRKVAGAMCEHLDRPIVDVDLGAVNRRPERPSIDYVLEQQLADAPDEAVVFVWNLESLLPTTAVDRDVTEKTLKEVNWRRGTYERLDRPLVVWLPEYAIRYLAQNAPDFFDWNSGLYAFKTPASERSSLLQASLDRLEVGIEAESLVKEEKRHREAYLRSLLEEYGEDSAFDQKARTDILLRLARLHVGRGSYARARQLVREALALARETEDQAREATARHQLATIALERGAYAEAEEQFRKSLQINQDIGNRAGEAATRHNLAMIAMERGKYAEAEEQFREALQIVREIGDRSREAATRHQLATIALDQGEYTEAEERFRKALQIRQEIGDQWGEATTFAQLGVLAEEGFRQTTVGLQLLLISQFILDNIGHAHGEKVEPWVNGLASELDYTQEDFDAARQEAVDSYLQDGGWSLIHDAFGEGAAASNW